MFCEWSAHSLKASYYLLFAKANDLECRKHFFFDLLKTGLPFGLLFLALRFRVKNKKRRIESSLCIIFKNTHI